MMALAARKSVAAQGGNHVLDFVKTAERLILLTPSLGRSMPR